MRGYAFAEAVSACQPEDRLILLDLARDRYFGLGESSERALSRLMAGIATAGDQPAIDMMTENGLLIRAGDGHVPRLCPIVPPAESAPPLGDHRASRWQSTLSILAILRAHRELKGGGFAAMIAELRRKRPTETKMSTEQQEAITATFRGALGLVSALDQCLPRSLALAQRLFAAGIDADLIVGVAVRPFRAHCWVQRQGRLLIDDVDTVRPFTPILLL